MPVVTGGTPSLVPSRTMHLTMNRGSGENSKYPLVDAPPKGLVVVGLLPSKLLLVPPNALVPVLGCPNALPWLPVFPKAPPVVPPNAEFPPPNAPKPPVAGLAPNAPVLVFPNAPGD